MAMATPSEGQFSATAVRHRLLREKENKKTCPIFFFILVVFVRFFCIFWRGAGEKAREVGIESPYLIMEALSLICRVLYVSSCRCVGTCGTFKYHVGTCGCVCMRVYVSTGKYYVGAYGCVCMRVYVSTGKYCVGTVGILVHVGM